MLLGFIVCLGSLLCNNCVITALHYHSQSRLVWWLSFTVFYTSPVAVVVSCLAVVLSCLVVVVLV
jgi:hypothetical protein